MKAKNDQNSDFSALERKEMQFAMLLSLLVGIGLLLIKCFAYFLTNSTAILSDAAESVIHVFAVGFASYSMWLSLKPADENHIYGHERIAFFSTGFEGAMIIIAAFYIFYESITKIIFGFQIENIGIGIFFTIASIFINLFLGRFLIRKGTKYHSIILESDGRHILTDCWISGGVIIALLLVKLTGFVIFDPLVAILTALNILWTGAKLIKKSITGLMDQTDKIMQDRLTDILKRETTHQGIEFHHLRHRMLGHKIFIEFHLLFPNPISLKEAHETATHIEANIKKSLEQPSEILSHLEPKQGHDQIHKKYGIKI